MRTIQSGGIWPEFTVTASSAPNRSEAGVGAMLPWADKLWVVSYLSVPKGEGGGTGSALYSLDDSWTWRVEHVHNSTYANRMIVPAMQSIVIGPYIIDAEGSIRILTEMLYVRLGGMALHLTKPKSVYLLGMDGPLWEADLETLNVTKLFDLPEVLGMPPHEQPHFKAAHSVSGWLYVATNSFFEDDYLGQVHGGRLAAYNGSAWTVLEETAFQEVTGRFNFGRMVFATGWDDSSAILKVLDAGDGADPTHDENWQRYRLPVSSHTWEHAWTTEWPRIKELASERYVLDASGGFYELAPLGYDGAVWGVRPISTHLRIVPDMCPFRGFVALGGNQVSSIFDNNLETGQAQSGLRFIAEDDMWSFGKPQGWGSVWRGEAVPAGVPSDPFLMTGYVHKVLHLVTTPLSIASTGVKERFERLRSAHARRVRRNRGAGAAAASWETTEPTVFIEIDVLGCAGHFRCPADWQVYQNVTVGATGLQTITFPEGFSAHWVRLTPSQNMNITAQFMYT